MLPSKWKNLSRYYTRLIIHACKKLPLTLDCRANILSKYIIYNFFNFGRGFCGFFPMLFPKAPASGCKNILTDFCCIVLLYLWAQKVSQIFKILFQTGDINIFVLRGVFFSRYVQLKSSFSDEKNISGKIWDIL